MLRNKSNKKKNNFGKQLDLFKDSKKVKKASSSSSYNSSNKSKTDMHRLSLLVKDYKSKYKQQMPKKLEFFREKFKSSSKAYYQDVLIKEVINPKIKKMDSMLKDLEVYFEKRGFLSYRLAYNFVKKTKLKAEETKKDVYNLLDLYKQKELLKKQKNNSKQLEFYNNKIKDLENHIKNIQSRKSISSQDAKEVKDLEKNLIPKLESEIQHYNNLKKGSSKEYLKSLNSDIKKLKEKLSKEVPDLIIKENSIITNINQRILGYELYGTKHSKKPY